MRLAERTDYGLRVLMLLAASEDRRPVSAMAEALGVSPNHLAKVVQALQGAGWVVTTPGRRGGAELAVDASSLTVGEVVRALEPDMALVECMRADGACPLSGGCRLASALEDARDAFIRELDAVTLANLIARRRSRLVRLGSERGTRER